MDLGLDIVRTRGRAPKSVEAEVIRPLNSADLALLATEKGVKAPPLTRIRDRHHALARALASGMSPGQASIITGYSLSRISILIADPAFRELLAVYRSEADGIFTDMAERMASLGKEAVEELHDRLEETPESFEIDDLIDVVKLTADRTGHGPQTKSTQVNVNVNLAGRLEAARRRAGLVEVLPPPPNSESVP